jgi:CubicO group peptidase (beta-lactamase class C family)
MNKWAYRFGFLLFITAAQAQQAPGLSSPKSIFENIENIAVKREVLASETSRTLISVESTSNIKKLAAEHLNARGNVALLLIDSGRIVFEGYAKGSNENHKFISMSMAKSLTALAIGEALCAGKISSLNDPAQKYAPELKGLVLGSTKIIDLLKMNSGVKTSQNFHGNPYPTSGDDLLFQRVTTLEILKKYDNSGFQSLFGNTWNYSNLDTDALNYVLRGSTGLSLGDWYAATVAKKAGLASKSYWGLDSNGVEIAPSFYFATLRDWARLALYIRDAYKNPADSCIKDFILQATKNQIQARSSEFKHYGYQFFASNTTTIMNDFWMVGYAGQRIGFNMDEDKIILNFSWAPDPERTYSLFRNWIKM